MNSPVGIMFCRICIFHDCDTWTFPRPVCIKIIKWFWCSEIRSEMNIHGRSFHEQSLKWKQHCNQRLILSTRSYNTITESERIKCKFSIYLLAFLTMPCNFLWLLQHVTQKCYISRFNLIKSLKIETQFG